MATSDGGLRINVRIEGAFELAAAVRNLGRDADKDLRREAFDIADHLSDKIKIAGRAESRQAGRAASSVKAVRDRFPVIRAGGTARSTPVLFGSEFGMTRRSGWYRKGRYGSSVRRQFKPHLGAGSYWFFKTAERETGWVAREWRDAAERIIESHLGAV